MGFQSHVRIRITLAVVVTINAAYGMNSLLPAAQRTMSAVHTHVALLAKLVLFFLETVPRNCPIVYPIHSRCHFCFKTNCNASLS
jgi:hypothetical protein